MMSLTLLMSLFCLQHMELVAVSEDVRGMRVVEHLGKKVQVASGITHLFVEFKGVGSGVIIGIVV